MSNSRRIRRQQQHRMGTIPRGQKGQTKMERKAMPVTDYRDMDGWPGVIPHERLRNLAETLETQNLPKDEQSLADLGMMIKAQECMQFSAKRPTATQVKVSNRLNRKAEPMPNPEQLAQAAWTRDTTDTMGGILSAIRPDGRSEEQVIFSLLRDPEWTGFNTVLPMLRGLNVTISESREIPGHPGIIQAEPPQAGFPPGATRTIPAGPAQRLAEILRYHRVEQVRWRPQSEDANRNSRHDR